ncbi:MAG: transporter substrate-binding domain-containing protein [Synergistaceae bacterium]|nr:transporter substrate-binding domain-containing protein [Synergistaceae bacterium]
MKKLTAIALTLVMALTAGAAFCAPAGKFTTPEDLKAVKVGTQRGTIAEGIAKEMLGDKAAEQLTTYEKATDVIAALKLGKVQGTIMDEAPAVQFKKQDPDHLTILPDALTTEEYAIGFKQGNTELREQVNKALAEIKADGTLEAIMLKYKEDPTAPKPEDIDLNVGAKGGKLYLGTESGFPPYDIKVGDGYTGIDIEMCAAIAKKLDKELAIIAYPFDSLFMAVNSGKVDMICAGITVNEERKLFTDFSDPYENARQVAVVMTKDYVAPAK